MEHNISGLKTEVSGLKAEIIELRRGMDARFDTVHTRFDTMEKRFDARFDRLQSDVHVRIDTIYDAMRSQTRWLVGTLIAVGGLISVLITIFEFIK
ncbi:MAG: hypothetical protein ACE5LU_13330 [Anaerolineae bacterium]